MAEKSMLTIRETVARLKTEGLQVSEYCLRQWVRRGEIPRRQAGQKTLLYWPNVLEYITGGDQTPATPTASGIRRIQ